MNPPGLDLTGRVVVVVYFIALMLAGLAYLRRERTSAGYFLAGRSLSLPAFVATLVSTWYGGILGVGEYAHQYGISCWTVFGLPYYIFALVFALWLAPRIRESKLYTIPDKIADRYGRGPGLIAAVLTYGMTNPAAYVLMLGVLLQLTFGWPLIPAMLSGVVFSTIYVYVGGFRADVRVNILQFVLMFAGFALILPYCHSQLGNFSWLARHLPANHLTFSGGNTPQYLVAWFFIALWTMVDPGFHQRCYAASSPKTARNGIVVSILFWMIFDFMTVTAGLYARAALPNIDPKMAYPLLAEQLLPPLVKGIFYVAMLATVMSTLVSNTFLSGVTFARDIVWRLKGGDEDAGVGRHTAIGLLLTTTLAILLAIWKPSVVDLWYTIGTCFIPGLLLPVLLAYGSRRRHRAGWVSAAMLGGSGTALTWLMLGQRHLVDGWPHYPFGVEPMYPGLLVSMLVFGLSSSFASAPDEAPREA